MSARRAMAMVAAVTLASAVLAAPVRSGIGNCGVQGKCPATQQPSLAPTPGATASPTPGPTVAPTSGGYTFDDEFSGTAVATVWQHHYHCCGTVTMDPTLSSVSGGYLHQQVVNRSGTWYADILDTKTTFTQTYGYFEARLQIAKGKGFWPAFWLYNDALSGADEIDTMEVCANPLSANGGNDASLLHNTVHITGSSLGNPTRTADLSLAFHTYAVDWRPTYIAFYLDGVQVWREAGLLVATAKALLLNFGVGGSWCSAPDAMTPSPAEQQTDWVRVRA